MKQMQDAQKVTQKAESHFEKKVKEMESHLTWDLMRPAMKKSWDCSSKCADPDSGSADDFGSCLQDCQQPVQDLQDQQQQYMQQVMQQEQQIQQYCQEVGQQKNQTQMDMAHCTAD